MKLLVWLLLVRRDFGIQDILNESCTKMHWKVVYLFTAVVLKVKRCPKFGYWISVLRFKSSTLKVSVWPLQVSRDFRMQDIWSESSTKMHWKVDYLFTAVVLKLKKCPKSGYWVSVLRFKSSTMKVSFRPLQVRRDSGIQDILSVIRIRIYWKVDYLFTVVVLKVKKYPKCGFWISVLRFKSSTMNVSVWPLQVRRDCGIQDILSEIRIRIYWKVD